MYDGPSTTVRKKIESVSDVFNDLGVDVCREVGGGGAETREWKMRERKDRYEIMRKCRGEKCSCGKLGRVLQGWKRS